MSEFTRKALKHDAFVEEVGESWQFFQQHRTPILVIAGLVLAAIVGGYSYLGYKERLREEASAALQDAIRQFHGVVTVENRPGFITYTTSGERYRASKTAFEEVLGEYGGTPAAVGAEYYLGLLEIEEGNLDGAAAQLQKAVDAGDEPYGPLAQLSLADVLARQGKLDEARTHYEELIENPTTVIPASRAKLALARALADSRPDEARVLLEELMAEPGPASAAAGNLLRTLPGA